MSRRPLKIAIEGCGHGTLHAIYASIAEASAKKPGWENGPELVIIGGDFQAVRNADDLAAMSVPAKYRAIGDFWEYYAGKRKAPYLTIFIGGNHEASNHLFELYYGGWVAPNIYYLGAANVVRFGGLRIAGLSGIWKGYNYRKPHYERLPYTADDVKSIYHVRELDVRKLLQYRSQVDIGLSHDWPQGVEWLGKYDQLFRLKPDFRSDAETERLGSKAARYVLDQLRPLYWFSAHLHCKYTARIKHDGNQESTALPEAVDGNALHKAPAKNEDEIDIDMDDEDDEPTSSKPEVAPETHAASTPNTIEAGNPGGNEVSADLRAQLPASFAKQPQDKPSKIPPGITNNETKFLALDKCLPRRRFLQLMEIEALEEDPAEPLNLAYDSEWLAITRALAGELNLGDSEVRVPVADFDSYPARIDEARGWVEKNVVAQNKLKVPENFEMTAVAYDEAKGIRDVQRPSEYTNPQTTHFVNCSGLGIPLILMKKKDKSATIVLQRSQTRKAPALFAEAEEADQEAVGVSEEGQAAVAAGDEEAIERIECFLVESKVAYLRHHRRRVERSPYRITPPLTHIGKLTTTDHSIYITTYVSA